MNELTALIHTGYGIIFGLWAAAFVWAAAALIRNRDKHHE